MTAPSKFDVSTEHRADEDAAFRRHGILAGVLGAIVLAGWFLLIDIMHGRPLFTPTLLAETILHPSETIDPATLSGSIPMTFFFTVVHGIMFALLGLAVGELLRRFAGVRSRGMLVVVLFAALCIAFFSFAFNVSVVGADAVAIRDAFIGNALAAFAMTAYLAHYLPHETFG